MRVKKLCALLLTLLLLLGAAEAEPLFEPTQEEIYNYCPAGEQFESHCCLRA